MKKKLLGLMLFAGMSVFGQISIGVHIGPPPPPRIEIRHESPGVGYSYVEGYWYPAGGHYKWHSGYWSRPPYEGAVWVGPHHDGQQYYEGYWKGAGHEPMPHDHASDTNHDRDYHPPN